MKNVKKILSFLVCIALIFSLVGCGLAESNPTNTTQTNENESHDHEHDHDHEHYNDSSTEEIIDLENHVHEYEIEVIKEATCLENGMQKYTCKCGDSYEEEIPALGHDYVAKTVAPTYEAKGYTEHTCSRCGDTYKDEYVDQLVKDDGTTPVHKHEYKSEITKPVSCLVAGEKTYTCECGDTHTEKIPATGHEYKETKTNPTCTERGYTTHTCKECGYSYNDTYTAPLDHSYGSWKSVDNNEHAATCTRCGAKKTEAHSWTGRTTKAPTCTTEGTKTFTCNCGNTYTETIAALGHNYKDTVVAPTQTEKGYTLHTCQRCGDSYKDNYVPALGHDETHTHSYTSKVTKEATCTTDGVRTYTCSCGDTYTEVIKATGHSYVATTTAPTCTERGYTTHKCSKCGDSYKDNYVEANGHKFDSGKVTKVATCSSEGVRTYTCTVCKTTKTESIPKTAHVETTKNAKAATCTEAGYSGDTVCSVCGALIKSGYTIAATGHSWNSGVVTKQPTCTAQGTKTYTCTKCGGTKTESIAATGHQHTEIRNNKSATCTENGYTGDTYCKDCGAKISSGSSIPATGHSYGSWSKQDDNKHVRTCSKCGAKETANHSWNNGVVTKAATCKETGIKTYTCSVCGDTKTETIPKTTTHSWNSGVVTTAPTCKTSGVKTYTCNVCGTTKTETVPATGHQHTEIRNKKDATCTEAGYSGDTYCKDCGTKLSSGSTIAALGHSWNSGTVTTAATCTNDGVKTYTCTRCGAKKTESIQATGHTWDIDHVSKVATCTEQGEVVYKCTKCNTTKTEATPIDPNNHDYKCTHEAWDEQVPVYATCGITRWYVYYNPYPVGDPRRFDDTCTVYDEWTARDDFEDEVAAARSVYSAKLKEITDNGWLKKTAGYGATGETASYIAYYKTVHHDAEYTCSRCGKVKP